MFFVIATPARTFSSLVANIMHNSGIPMNLPGTPMNKPDYANIHGFYEAGWAINLNEHILGELGHSGTMNMGKPPNIDAVRRMVGTKTQTLIFDSVRYVHGQMHETKVKDFGVKDNRICYLAPLWFAPLLAFEARLITVQRPEQDTVASIMDTWPEAFFWREDALTAYREAKGRIEAMMASWPFPTHHVNGDALFDDTDSELARLSDFLGRSLRSDAVDPSGRHHKALDMAAPREYNGTV